jgi:hypothetical protein
MVEVVVNQDKTQATLHYSNGRTVHLSHSEGLVLDLVALMLAPIGVQHQVTMLGLLRSLEDTAEIDLKAIA